MLIQGVMSVPPFRYLPQTFEWKETVRMLGERRAHSCTHV